MLISAIKAQFSEQIKSSTILAFRQLDFTLSYLFYFIFIKSCWIKFVLNFRFFTLSENILFEFNPYHPNFTFLYPQQNKTLTLPAPCFSESSIKKKKQEMPSRQQKSAKKDLERYLMFGPNHILVTLRWDDGRFPGHENVCRWLNIYK